MIFAALVFVSALNPPDMIIWLNLLAFGGLQAVFLWPLVLGLYWKKASAAGALGSMLVGLGSYIAFALIKPDLGHVHAIVPTLILSLLTFVLFSYLRPNTEETQIQRKPV